MTNANGEDRERGRPEKFEIKIDRKHYQVEKDEMTGAELRQVPHEPIGARSRPVRSRAGGAGQEDRAQDGGEDQEREALLHGSGAHQSRKSVACCPHRTRRS